MPEIIKAAHISSFEELEEQAVREVVAGLKAGRSWNPFQEMGTKYAVVAVEVIEAYVEAVQKGDGEEGIPVGLKDWHWFFFPRKAGSNCNYTFGGRHGPGKVVRCCDCWGEFRVPEK